FGEQAVLCGGVLTLVIAAFETLVARGFDPQVAYIECCHELKQVTDLLYAGGLTGMADAISNTAEFGAHVAREHLDTDELRASLHALLADIQNGEFARRFRTDLDAGAPHFAKVRQDVANHPIEEAGRTVRALMPWLTGNTASN
ncbi:MAG: ketol-acid reductoisomerase, partial [Planctomycetota bacterium]